MVKDITILIGGAAGQGIQTIGALLAKVCHNAGLFIFSVDDFEYCFAKIRLNDILGRA